MFYSIIQLNISIFYISKEQTCFLVSMEGWKMMSLQMKGI